MANSLLIQGPMGGRQIDGVALSRCSSELALLSEREARRFAAFAKLDGWGRLDPRLMPWYVEFAVTGLTETLADVQLFGTVRASYTDAEARPGIFEAAQVGQGRSAGREDPGSLLTGGVVFLDEIGDLSPLHQAKLLPVLSGGSFYQNR